MSIVVKPINANLTHDTDFFDNMDPYVQITIGSQKKRTATHHGAGKNPQWCDTLVFNTKAQTLHIKVWDSDTITADDLVGEGTMNLNNLYSQPNRTQNCIQQSNIEYVDLTYKSKIAGRILLSVEYQGPPIGGNNNYGGNSNTWGNNNNNGGNNNNGWGSNNNGWGNTQPLNNNWGGNNNGWGNNNSAWGNDNNSWGNNNNGWGNNNNGWGNNNNGWGNNNNSWGNNNSWNGPPQNNGWGNQPQNNYGQSNWDNNGGRNNNNNSYGPLVFIVKPIQAQLTHDLDTFSKMDPFVQISLGNNRQRSMTQQGAGKYPKFVDTFTFTSGDRLMSVTVYDQDVLENELVGQGTLDLNKAANNIGMAQNQYVNLIKHGETAGRILISVQAKQSNTGYGW